MHATEQKNVDKVSQPNQAKVTAEKQSALASKEDNLRWQQIAYSENNSALIQRSCAECEAEQLEVQPMLNVGAADSPFEKEADSVADEVMNPSTSSRSKVTHISKLSSSTISTKSTANTGGFGSKGEIKHATKNESRGQGIESYVSSLSGKGQHLSRSEQAFFAARFGRTFDGVRLHTDQSAYKAASSINAKAFTHGNHIVFNQGAYQPNQSESMHLLAHELTHTVQQSQGQESSIQREPLDEEQSEFNPDGEYSKPPAMDSETAEKLAVASVVQDSTSNGGTDQKNLSATPASDTQSGPQQLTLEKLLSQPDLKRVLRHMANDLGYIVDLYPPGEINTAKANEFKEHGVKGTLIDGVAILTSKLGIWETAVEARKELLKGLKGLPAKAVEAVLNKLLEMGKSAASNGPTSPYGQELTAYEGFPIVGSMEFEMDMSPAPALKTMPSIKFKGGNIGGRVKPNERVAVDFTVIWPKLREDKSMPDGQKRVLERWRIDVLAESGAYQVGLEGLNGWTGFSQYIQPNKDSGTLRFFAPSLPGLYQARLVNTEGVKARVLFRVAGST